MILSDRNGRRITILDNFPDTIKNGRSIKESNCPICGDSRITQLRLYPDDTSMYKCNVCSHIWVK